MKKIIDSLNYKKQLLSFASGEQIVHIIEYSQNNNNLTLLISKTSEALNPLGNMNHIGDGGTINDFLKIQNIPVKVVYL